MTCFVSFDTTILDALRRLFCGCCLFDIDGPKGGEFIIVRLPCKPVSEQAAMLDSVYSHANRLAR